MKSKEEFNRSKWHLVFVGLATLGRQLDERGTPLEKATKHARVGDEMFKLMEELHDWLNDEKKGSK